MHPKAFLSYSWSSGEHQELITTWAERLLADGVDVVFDRYDLKEGHDKFAFMERMVTDPSVTHVLVFSDAKYAEKADARAAGVGTESQIISREVYEKIDQSKFIPIICEKDATGNPHLPTFMKSRIWIDFSSPQAVNDSWERLIRLLHGKPAIERPALGKPPAYLESTSTPASPVAAKFATLQNAILNGRPTVPLCRRAFLDECLAHAESLRVRMRPDAETLGQKILEDSGKLKQIRQQIVDWIMLEGIVTSTSDEQLSEALLSFLERLRALKGRTPEITAWHDAWFEAHALFVYETFLYVVAALMQTRRYLVLADLLSIQYAIPASEGSGPFKGFDTFSAHSEALQQVLAPPGRRLYSPAAALIQRQADRHDISFTNLQEADALAFLVSVLSQNLRWYPQLLLYLSYGSILPFFHRAGYRKHFAPLDAVTGIANGNDLRRLSNAGVCDCRLVNGHSSLMAPDLSRRSTSQRLTHSKQRKWGLV